MSGILCDLRDAQALRLMRTFNQINDRQTRCLIVAVAEALARGAMAKVETLGLRDLPKLDA